VRLSDEGETRWLPTSMSCATWFQHVQLWLGNRTNLPSSEWPSLTWKH